MFSTMLFFMGQFALFTYLRPFLETQTKVDFEILSLILLTMGIGGLIGTFIIGNILKTRLYSLLIITPFLMMLIVIGLIYFAHSVTAIFILMTLWGFLGTSAPVAWWTWLSKTLPHEAEAGGGLMVAIVQLAITLGASIGGMFFDIYGYEITFVFSAIILAIATIMASITAFYTYKKQ